MLFVAALVWILPLFPAQPKLGPVLNPVTQFIPPKFPLLLIVPAFAIDLVRGRIAHGTCGFRRLCWAPCFSECSGASQWWFADFLMSSGGGQRVFRNHLSRLFFGTGLRLKRETCSFARERNFSTVMAIALGASIVMSRIGVGMGAMDGNGQAMKRVALWIAVAMAAQAHVGSPDVFLEGSAGAYPMYS